MLVLEGQYNTASVMTDDVDPATMSQIYSFLNHPAFADTHIVIMPDCHAGAGAVIGFTAIMNDYIIPNVVGVDIGCGVLACKLPKVGEIDFAALDNYIRTHIPSGFCKRAEPLAITDPRLLTQIEGVVEATGQDKAAVLCSLGTLGGGNHFIEVDGHDGEFWLLVHTGSRNFGLRVATFHQRAAKAMNAGAGELAYLMVHEEEGERYLGHMEVAQRYARVNRSLIASQIMGEFFGATIDESVESVHNYIDFADNVIRKGAISAKEDERVVIPLNMRDGVIFGKGKGNAEWNNSAPHGAGRVLSRSQAKAVLKVEDFQDSMEGVWTSCVSQGTLDESPMAYKDSGTITELVAETMDIDFIAKPVYNFKAG